MTDLNTVCNTINPTNTLFSSFEVLVKGHWYSPKGNQILKIFKDLDIIIKILSDFILSVYSTGKMKSLHVGFYSSWCFLCMSRTLRRVRFALQAGTVIYCKLGLIWGITTLQDTPIEIHCIEHKAYEVQSCGVLIQVLYITVLSNRSQTVTTSTVKTLRHSDERAAEQFLSVQEEEAFNGTVISPSSMISHDSARVIDWCDLLLNGQWVILSRVIFNVTEKAMAVEDTELMSAEAPSCRRAASAPSGCQSRRASWRNPVHPLDFCWVGICRDLMQEDTKQKCDWKDACKSQRGNVIKVISRLTEWLASTVPHLPNCVSYNTLER